MDPSVSTQSTKALDVHTFHTNSPVAFNTSPSLLTSILESSVHSVPSSSIALPTSFEPSEKTHPNSNLDSSKNNSNVNTAPSVPHSPPDHEIQIVVKNTILPPEALSFKRRLALAIFTPLIIFLFSGLTAGYSPFKTTLLARGTYSWFCPSNTTDASMYPNKSPTPCHAQIMHLDLMNTLANAIGAFLIVPVGIILDKLGPKLLYLISTTFYTFGCALMCLFFTLRTQIDLLIPGFIILNFAGSAIFSGSFHISNAFPNHASWLTLSFNVAFDLSAMVFSLLNSLHDALNTESAKEQVLPYFFSIYIVFAIVFFLFSFFMIPKSSLKASQFATYKDSTSTPLSSSSSNQHEHFNLNESGHSDVGVNKALGFSDTSTTLHALSASDSCPAPFLTSQIQKTAVSIPAPPPSVMSSQPSNSPLTSQGSTPNKALVHSSILSSSTMPEQDAPFIPGQILTTAVTPPPPLSSFPVPPSSSLSSSLLVTVQPLRPTTLHDFPFPSIVGRSHSQSLNLSTSLPSASPSHFTQTANKAIPSKERHDKIEGDVNRTRISFHRASMHSHHSKSFPRSPLVSSLPPSSNVPIPIPIDPSRTRKQSIVSSLILSSFVPPTVVQEYTSRSRDTLSSISHPYSTSSPSNSVSSNHNAFSPAHFLLHPPLPALFNAASTSHSSSYAASSSSPSPSSSPKSTASFPFSSPPEFQLPPTQRQRRLSLCFQQVQTSKWYLSLQQHSIEKQCRSPFYYLFLVNVTLTVSLLNYYILTINNQWRLLSDVHDQVLLREVWAFLLPLSGIAIAPLLGYLLTHLAYHHLFFLISLLAFLASMCLPFSLIPLQFTSMVCMGVLRPIVWTVASDYLGKVFGFDSFGRLYGCLLFFIGMFNFVGFGFNYLGLVVFQQYWVPNLIMVALQLLTFIFPCVLYVWHRRFITTHLNTTPTITLPINSFNPEEDQSHSSSHSPKRDRLGGIAGSFRCSKIEPFATTPTKKGVSIESKKKESTPSRKSLHSSIKISAVIPFNENDPFSDSASDSKNKDNLEKD